MNIEQGTNHGSDAQPGTQESARKADTQPHEADAPQSEGEEKTLDTPVEENIHGFERYQ